MSAHPKPQRERDAAYLAYIRKQPCCVSGKLGVDAHHVRLGNVGGMGTKAPDRFAIPLHRDFHREFHDLGMMGFETKYGIDCAKIVADLNRAYRPAKPRKVIHRTPVVESFHIKYCVCSRTHDIPSSKITTFGAGFRYQCPEKNTPVSARLKR